MKFEWTAHPFNIDFFVKALFSNLTPQYKLSSKSIVFGQKVLHFSCKNTAFILLLSLKFS